jgi:N-acetylmuramoyl-L-alanine amidase
LPLVVIDPGHGGKDPGCSGPRGTQEKTVALELGLELQRQLHAGGRCRVAMTRSGDVFVPLEQRVGFARRQRAALFVSLHANAALHDRHARGACVYRFAYRASDAQARALAKWENSADRYGGPAFRDASPTLTHILASLMRKETWKHSAWLQQGVVDAMHRRIALTPAPARHARFVVLSAPDIASVLVEIGFLTNPAEERLLRSASHRRALALALRHGVERYLARVPHGGAA